MYVRIGTRYLTWRLHSAWMPNRQTNLRYGAGQGRGLEYSTQVGEMKKQSAYHLGRLVSSIRCMVDVMISCFLPDIDVNLKPRYGEEKS